MRAKTNVLTSGRTGAAGLVDDGLALLLVPGGEGIGGERVIGALAQLLDVPAVHEGLRDVHGLVLGLRGRLDILLTLRLLLGALGLTARVAAFRLSLFALFLCHFGAVRVSLRLAGDWTVEMTRGPLPYNTL